MTSPIDKLFEEIFGHSPTPCGTCFITYLCGNFLATINIYKKHIINLKFI